MHAALDTSNSRLPLRLQIRNDFVQRIHDGEFLPGQRIATVRDVAREYGVAPRTVSQAYELLQADGLIETRRGDGTYVRHTSEVEVETEVLFCIYEGFLSCDESSEKDSWLAFEWIRGMMKAARDCRIRLTPLASGEEFRPDHYDLSRLAVFLLDDDYAAYGFQPLVDFALAHGIPICGSRISDERITSLDNDRALAAEHMTAHLLALGHRRIALINSLVEESHGRDRSSAGQQRQGFFRAMDRAGIEPIYVESLPPERSGPLPTHKALSGLLDQASAPTAILCNNDVRAFAVLDFLKARGARVPADISVVGYDNRPQCRRCDPPLTTVDSRPAARGEEAIRYLVNRLSGRKTRPQACIPRLIVRESTGVPPSS